MTDRIDISDGVSIIADPPLEVEFTVVDKDAHDNPYAVLFQMMATYLRDGIEPLEVDAVTVRPVMLDGKLGLCGSLYSRTPLDWVKFLKREKDALS